MNFLGHLYLSGPVENVRFGNFIGDHVKGKSYERYKKKVREGILLHRFIDHYTDRHPIVRSSKKRLRPVYGKYAGIAVDVLYDHFLSAGWQDYHEQPLHSFSRKVYLMLLRKYFHLPAAAKQYVPFMIANNWLALYGRKGGIHRVLTGMAGYSSLPRRADDALLVIEKYYGAFKEEFEHFIPEIALAVAGEKNITVPGKLSERQ